MTCLIDISNLCLNHHAAPSRTVTLNVHRNLSPLYRRGKPETASLTATRTATTSHAGLHTPILMLHPAAGSNCCVLNHCLGSRVCPSWARVLKWHTPLWEMPAVGTEYTRPVDANWNVLTETKAFIRLPVVRTTVKDRCGNPDQRDDCIL